MSVRLSVSWRRTCQFIYHLSVVLFNFYYLKCENFKSCLFQHLPSLGNTPLSFLWIVAYKEKKQQILVTKNKNPTGTQTLT